MHLKRQQPFLVGLYLLIPILLFAFTAKQPIFLELDLPLIDLKSGREGSLAVVEWADGEKALIADNQYLLGSSVAKADEERQAHIGLLMHPKPEDIAVIGLGTGITAGASLRHGPVSSVTVMELSEHVAVAAKEHFAPFNNNVSDDPRVQICVEDARTLIQAARDKFDVIIGDLVTPWRPGAARLFTVEHFHAVYRALRPGGVFCQWLPMHQLTPTQFELIAATFAKAFPEIHLFRNHFKTKSLPMALVGFKGSALDWEIIRNRCEVETANGKMFDPLSRHAEGLAMLYLGNWSSEDSRNGPKNTLNNLFLEIDASRQVAIGIQEAYFTGIGEDWYRFIHGQLANLDSTESIPEPFCKFPLLGFRASRWEVAHSSNDPNEDRFRREFESKLPSTLTRDSHADWSLWAGSQVPSIVSARL